MFFHQRNFTPRSSQNSRGQDWRENVGTKVVLFGWQEVADVNLFTICHRTSAGLSIILQTQKKHYHPSPATQTRRQIGTYQCHMADVKHQTLKTLRRAVVFIFDKQNCQKGYPTTLAMSLDCPKEAERCTHQARSIEEAVPLVICREAAEGFNFALPAHCQAVSHAARGCRWTASRMW